MKLIRGIFLALLSLVLVACGSDDKKNVSVSVTPMTATIKAGTTQTFMASVTGSSNTEVTLPPLA